MASNHAFIFYSGEKGIRTPGTLLEYTRFPSVPLKPLEHLSNNLIGRQRYKKILTCNILYDIFLFLKTRWQKIVNNFGF